jgi:hypothetical protein
MSAKRYVLLVETPDADTGERGVDTVYGSAMNGGFTADEVTEAQQAVRDFLAQLDVTGATVTVAELVRTPPEMVRDMIRDQVRRAVGQMPPGAPFTTADLRQHIEANREDDSHGQGQ